MAQRISAPVKSAPESVAPLRDALVRFAWPRLALVRLEDWNDEEVRFWSAKLAPEKLTLYRAILDKSWA